MQEKQQFTEKQIDYFMDLALAEAKKGSQQN